MNLTDSRLVFAPGVTLIASTQVHEHCWESRSPAFKRLPLQDMGTHGDRLIEFAGRGCYDSYGQGRDSAAYHKHIQDVGHGSVLEHVSMTFWLTGISLGLTHELVRHRVVVAISQRSTRYVTESNSRIVVPPLFIVKDGDSTEAGWLKRKIQSNLLLAHETATTVYDATFLAGVDLLPLGMDKTTARKTARGAARASLGQDLETSMTWTVNVRSLIGFLVQRASPYAEAEIRRLAVALLGVAREICPAYFSQVKLVDSPDGLGPSIDPTTLSRL